MSLDAIRSYGDLRDDVVVDADVAIIGSGPGGAAAAARLAEAGKRVVILEGGSYFRSQDFPPQASVSLHNLYLENGQLAAASPTGTFVPLASGQGVGGGTLINSAMCFRGPEHRLEEWARFIGSERYAPANMARLYDEIEETLHVETTPQDLEIAGINNLKTFEGIRALGMEGGMVRRNTPGCLGCGVCYMGCPVGGKGSVDRNFLGARAFAHDTVLYADTFASEFLLEGGRVVGVRGRQREPHTRMPGPLITVRAPRTIVAGGAIGTAKLMLSTGISGNEHVGRHLHLHPTGSVYAYFGEDVRMWRGATQGSYGHHPDHPDILIEAFSVTAEVLFAQAAEAGQNGKEFLADVHRMAGTGFITRDDSEGHITMRDRGKAGITYDLIESDLEKMVGGLKLAAQVMFAAGAERVKPGLFPLEYCDSMEDLERQVPARVSPNDIYLYASHPMSSCRMASRPEDGVVDARGEVFDVPGLYIADSSVFPAALGRNPQMTVMAFALNVAEQMLEDW